MDDKMEETVHDNKTLRLNKPETYVLTDKQFKTYMVSVFSDFDKTQTYKMPYRDSPHREIEKLMSFN